MTADEAIQRLGDMQAQIIDGKPTFKEIADVLREAKSIIGFVVEPTHDNNGTHFKRRAKKWIGE